MMSGTPHWNISFVIHNLLAFALVICLQNHYLLTTTVTCAAVTLSQKRSVLRATDALTEGIQLNVFNTTSTISASSSRSSVYLSSPPSVKETTNSHQQLSTSIVYPTFAVTPNIKTVRIMNTLSSISPTQMYTPSKATKSSGVAYTNVSKKEAATMGTLNHSLSSYATSATRGRRISNSDTALSSFKIVNNNKGSNRASNSDISKSHSVNVFKNDPFDSAKKHWSHSDAELNFGMDTSTTSRAIIENNGNFNLRLTSLSAATSSSFSSSISAFSSSSSLLSSATTIATERPRVFRNKHHHERHWGPFFEKPINSTTSGDNSLTIAHLYTEAVLNCRVGMLKDKTVMWVRRTAEKVSLLTVGNVTYSSDPRIRVKFQYPNNWRLLINPTHWDDSGIYMCQVSTHPPRVFTTNLTVVEPPLRLIDDQERSVGDRYYKTGSTIDLQCQVSRSFLYKEKQNILKSLKPLNEYSDTSTSSNNNNNKNKNSSINTFATTSGTSGGSVSSITLNAAHNNNNAKNLTKTTANKTTSAANVQDSSLPSTTSSFSFGDYNYNLLQNMQQQQQQQSAASANKQEIALEQQFSNFVFWLKDDEKLPPTALKHISLNDKWFTSRVRIADAKLFDSGNYSCSIGRVFTAIVQVQVLTGELPAAVQHNSAAAIVVCIINIKEFIQLYGFYIAAAHFLTT